MKVICYYVVTIVVTVWGTSSDVYAVLHPVLVDPIIYYCRAGAEGPCSADVRYSSQGSQLMDLVPAVPPLVGGGTHLIPWGIHCTYGNSVIGVPFSECRFLKPEMDHSPNMGTCRLRDETSWDLTPASDCVTTSPWGPHTGAGPGGECVLFAQMFQAGGGSLHTIYGVVTADQAANAGSRFCQKALPPDVVCSVDLPPTIDHGVVAPNSSSVVYVDGRVDCGGKPRVSIVGGEVVPVGPGLTTTLSADVAGANALRITSSLRAVNARPGPHHTSVIVRVSPY